MRSTRPRSRILLRFLSNNHRGAATPKYTIPCNTRLFCTKPKHEVHLHQILRPWIRSETGRQLIMDYPSPWTGALILGYKMSTHRMIVCHWGIMLSFWITTFTLEKSENTAWITSSGLHISCADNEVKVNNEHYEDSGDQWLWTDEDQRCRITEAKLRAYFRWKR